MFVYLSKKIAIPNGVKLRSVAWNHEQGWIACGGENGLLKVLKLDNGTGAGGKAANNLSMNQTLEGHDRAISVVAWNDQYRKMTSSDENGLIIVWMLHKGIWFEEMINNRNRSVVRDLAWNAEGQKVCIVYEDGAVIVGSVDGNRLWGKELKKQLTNVTWSPDGRYLLFGTMQGDVNFHDSTNGHMLTKLFIQCVDEGTENRLAGLQWHYGTVEGENGASLAVSYTNGKAQLMRSETDDKPYLIDTSLKIDTMKWNPQGTIVAFGGTPQNPVPGEKPAIFIQFYSNSAVHLRTLRVPGTSCGGVSWEGSGLRIALAIDSFIFFANVRPEYKWTYFNKTVVYAFTRPDKTDTSIMFWNPKNTERNVKSIKRLTQLKSAGDCCVIVNRVEENAVQHCLSLNNSIGGPLDNKYIDLEPLCVAMNEYSVIAASEEMIFVWQYRNPNVVVDLLDPLSIQQSRKETKERLIHIEDVVTADQIHSSMVKKGITNDHICTITASEQYLFVGRESGLLHIYSLNPLALVAKLTLSNRPQVLHANCDSTTLAVIDINGILSLVKLNQEVFSIIGKPAEMFPFERKDVWDFIWASDNPEMFAAMEKTRMYIFRGMEPEEPMQSSAHLCQFKNLKIKACLLDDCLQDPDHPTKESMLEFETKSLRDTREILSTVSLKEAFSYVEDHPHPRLWSILAEAALETLDFVIAEKAVVRCKEYPAIQFVKRIKQLDDPKKQKAEVLAYYHRFDEAEKVFKEMDRKDLAVELRARLGDWFRVVQLVQEGGGDEALIREAWEHLGDYYADRQKWTKAVQYYSQCKNYEKLASVYFVLEDYKGMERLIDLCEHNHDLLVQLGNRFLTAGLADAAVHSFLRANDITLAVNACVELNQWDQAVHLAEKHQLKEVGDLMAKYATHLVEKERIPQAIELYRKAGQHGEAAKLLSKLAHSVANQSPLKAKKFYVLAALEIEEFRKKKMTLATHKGATQVVDDLLKADSATAADRTLDSAWRGAEAYHFFMLCQSHLASNNVEAALCVAMRLMEYDDLINPTDSYSLIALTSLYARNYGICSKAFTRLEGIESGEGQSGELGQANLGMTGMMALDATDLDVAKTTMSATRTAKPTAPTAATRLLPTVGFEETERKYGDLAVKIFTKSTPADTSADKVKCPKCGTLNKDWAAICSRPECHQPFLACILSGKAITTQKTWQCTVCHHRALEAEMASFENCPMCHSPRQ